MKKSLLTIAAFVVAIAVNAQTYNYFDAADVDANGWLWFDTQEKLEKYCGWDSSYKIILQTATFEDADGQYAEPILDAEAIGYNTEGVEGGDGAKTGALILPAASATNDSPNGGGFMLWLPDCAEISLFISTENNKICTGVKGAKGWVEPIDCGLIKAYLSMSWGSLQPLAKVSQYQWNNIQDLSNANTGLTLKASLGNKVTGIILNNMKYPLYVHGIKVLTYTEPAGVANIAADVNDLSLAFDGTSLKASQNAEINVYTSAGALVASANGTKISLNGLATGVYVARATGDNGIVTIKIAK